MAFVDYISQERCRLCRRKIDVQIERPFSICRDCWRELAQHRPTVGHVEIDNQGTAMRVYSAVPYDDDARKLIHRFKYDSDFLVGEDLYLLIDRAWNHLFECERLWAPYLVPVPMHWIRYCLRGFNQAELLATSLSTKYGIDCHPHIIQRTRHTQPHHGLTRAQRESNVASAFACSRVSLLVLDALERLDNPMSISCLRGLFSGGFDRRSARTVIIVDDVLTTGSTLKRCAQALQAAGFSHILGLALARA